MGWCHKEHCLSHLNTPNLDTPRQTHTTFPQRVYIKQLDNQEYHTHQAREMIRSEKTPLWWALYSADHRS